MSCSCGGKQYLPGDLALFGERVARAFSLDPAQDGSMPGIMGGTVAPVVALSLDDHQFKYLSRINSFSGGSNLAAVALRSSVLNLTNPAGSGILARVTRLILCNPSAQLTVFWGVMTQGDAIIALLDSFAITRGVRDGRVQNNLGTSATARCTLFGGTQSGVPVGEFGTIPAAAGPILIPLDVTLSPGSVFFTYGAAANTSYSAAVSWEERVANATELK